MNMKRNSILAGLCIFAAVLSATLQVDAQDTRATAQNGPKAQTDAAKGPLATTPATKSSKPYYIEFRSRAALSYGHSFTVIGRVGSKITTNNVVGLHPFTESSVPWLIGHLIAVPSETGFSDGDIEDAYITARYRVFLTAAEHKKLMADVQKLKANSPLWHAAVYNCNAFVGDIAKSLGLKAPTNFWQYPKEYITELKQLNNSVKQLPKPVTTAAVQQ